MNLYLNRRIKINKERIEFEKVYESALTILDYAPQFSNNLKLKLLKKNYSIQIIENVIERLSENGLLDDEKNALNYTLELINNKLYGINKVIQKLEEKGIQQKTAKEIAAKTILLNGGEEKIIEKFIKKNILTFKNLYENKEIEKIKYKLYSKGFSYQTINLIIKNFEDFI